MLSVTFHLSFFVYRNYTLKETNVTTAETIARLCAEQGVEKLLHVSALNASEDVEGTFLNRQSQYLVTKVSLSIPLIYYYMYRVCSVSVACNISVSNFTEPKLRHTRFCFIYCPQCPTHIMGQTRLRDLSMYCLSSARTLSS